MSDGNRTNTEQVCRCECPECDGICVEWGVPCCKRCNPDD